MHDAERVTTTVAASGPRLDTAGSPTSGLVAAQTAPTGLLHVAAYEGLHRDKISRSLNAAAAFGFPPPSLSLPPQLPPPPPLHSSSSSSSSNSCGGGGGGGGGPAGMAGAGGLGMGGSPGPGAGEGGQVMVHWSRGTGPTVQSAPPPPAERGGAQMSGEDDDDVDDDDDELLTPPPPRERLSYTRYQLELLNGIYISVRYPNSVQKQLIAKRVGISREQVKIWFQNRRRKDVVGTKSSTDKSPSSTQEPASPSTSTCSSPAATPASSKASNNGNSQDGIRKSPDEEGGEGEGQGEGGPKSKMVPDAVIQGCISELKRFSDEKLKERKEKRKAKGKRRTHAAHASNNPPRPAHPALQGVVPASSNQPISRLFQAYDMVAPPNKVTPTAAAAYINTSANRFHHSHNSSAFSNPRDYLANASSAMPRLAWDTGLESAAGLSPSSLAGGVAESLAHSRAFGGLGMAGLGAGLGMGLMGSLGQPHQSVGVGVGMGSTPISVAGSQDSLPVLSDLLSYRQHVDAAANALSRDSRQPSLPQPSLLSSSARDPAAKLPDIGPSSSSAAATHHHHHHGAVGPPPPSPFGLSRVYPFPFIADPPIMLSSLHHQQDPLRHAHAAHAHAHAHWPHPHPHAHHPATTSAAHFNSMVSMNSLDPYKPVMISSLTNPFFAHSPHNPGPWPPHPGAGDPAPGGGFSQL